jgi:streptomycin 6-kinase
MELRPWETEMQELCELHRWQLLDEDLDAPFSLFVRRIIDEHGRRRILKIGGTGPAKAREAEVLLAFQASRRVPKVTVLSEDRPVMLINDLGGLTLNIAQHVDEEYLWRAAKLVRRLHRLPVPEWVLPMREFLALAYGPSLHDFACSEHAERREAVRRVAPVIATLARGPSEDRFLHGDFHPRNIIVAKGKLWAIDPFGLRGDRAYDLAVLAGHCHDPLRAATRLAHRYEERLRRFEPWLIVGCYAAYSHYTIRGENSQPALEALRQLTPGR